MKGTGARLGAGIVGLAVLFGSGHELDAQVVLNELLAVNDRTGFDEDGDSSDWVEILNRGTAPVSLLGHALSDDPLDPRKWLFPDIVLQPSERLLVWLSGKDRYVAAPTALGGDLLAVAFDPSLIRREATWKYLVAVPGSPGPPPGWNLVGFDAGQFTDGAAGFGYGDEDDVTELPDQTNAVFVRRELEVAQPSQLQNLILQIDYDDGFIAYLNGARVAAVNAPAEEPTFDTDAVGKREAGTPERFDLTPFLGLIVPGTNVLALVGLNDLPSSDMSLHPELGVVPRVLHASFRLSQGGEELTLNGPGGEVVDAVAFGLQTEDHSFGRVPDGDGEWLYLLTPSPELPNDSMGFSNPISSDVELDLPPGKYAFPIQVTMSAEPSGVAEIHFTTDGTLPTPASTAYIGPVRVERNTVFRVAAFIQGELATRVTARSFFIGGSTSLPTLSIAIDPDDFAAVHNNVSANGRSSEREGYFEYFTADGRPAVATGFGLRLHGGAGRGGDLATKKAYKAYFREVYGDSELRFPIIGETQVDEFDKLVLRSGFNDCFRTNGAAAYLRDEIVRDLHEDMGSLASHGTWCVLYVNMEFRGVYNVVERMDERFLGSYVDEADWDVIKTGNDVLVGTSDEWERLHNFFVQNDLSLEETYRQAVELLDLENFTSYMILNMWAQNHDWPHNNWYAARPRRPDGKWVFLCWDAEFGLGLAPGGFTSNSLEFTITRTGYIRDVFVGLLANQEYRAYFLAEMDRHLAGALRTDNVIAHTRSLRDVVAVDMPEEVALFGQSYGTWINNVQAIESFARGRGPSFAAYVRTSSYFRDTVALAPRIDSVEPSRVVNTGDTVVTLRGARLLSVNAVLFDSVLGEIVEVHAFGTALDVRLPFRAEISGPTTIRVVDGSTGLFGEARDVLDVALPVPVVASIAPESGAAAGGDRIVIQGENFLEGARVLFGFTVAPEVRVVDSRTLEVVTPPGSGSVGVTVFNTRPTTLGAVGSLRFTYLQNRFVRGDVNRSGLVDLSDAVAVLSYLFLGGSGLGCEAAADADGSAEIDLSDAVVILQYLFTGGAPLVPPFPSCGPSGELAGLPCADGGACD